MKVFYACLRNDMRVMLRCRSTWIHSLIFFIIFISLFGIALGFDSHFVKLSPAIVWIAFLVTSLFGIEAFFATEREEGMLEQLILSPHPLWWLICAKSVAIWIATCLPLILMSPFLGIMMQLSGLENFILILTLLVGSPALTFVGVIGAALTLALPRSGVFLGLLLLPLYIPILILGESALATLLASEWPDFQIILLGAISVLAFTLAPHAASAALKVAMD